MPSKAEQPTLVNNRKVTLQAPAKINLTLDVLSPRADGYHEIDSIMQTLSLADDVSLAWSDAPGVKLIVDGPEATGIPADEGNLAYRAAAKLLDAADSAERGITILLTKNIPSQAGLGGGSSDAAAVLIGVNELLGRPLTGSSLQPIARNLGADVAFFLRGGIARARGIGEIVDPVAGGSEQELLIVKPSDGVSTAQAYRALDAFPDRRSARATLAWPDGGVSNDFESVVYAMHPAIARTRERLLAAGAAAVLLCGSGSALAVFGGSRDALGRVAKDAGAAGIWRTRTTVSDPSGWRDKLWTV